MYSIKYNFKSLKVISQQNIIGKLYYNEIRFSVFFSNEVHNFYFSPKRIKADTALEFLKIDKVLNNNIGYSY